MKNRPDKGYALILVIMGIVVVGMIMTLLAHDSNTLLFETQKAHCQAVDRNLYLSALAWARHAGQPAMEQAQDLSCQEISGGADVRLEVRPDPNQAGAVQVLTQVSASLYRMTRSRSF